MARQTLYADVLAVALPTSLLIIHACTHCGCPQVEVHIITSSHASQVQAVQLQQALIK